MLSGAGHGALLIGLMVGGMFRAEPEPPDTVEVSAISVEEFEALLRPSRSPAAVSDISGLVGPGVTEAPPEVPRPEEQPPEREQPENALAERPDAAPVPLEALTPEPELADVPDDMPMPELEDGAAPVNAPLAEEAAPKPAPKVADLPVQDVPEAPEIADDPAPPLSESAEAAEPVEDRPQAAPEQTTTRIVTEADQPASSLGAVGRSIRPVARPVRPVPASATPEPAPEPAPDKPKPVPQDILADALSEALDQEAPEVQDPPETEPPVPSPVQAPLGPPLTSGEKEGLRLAVQRCWNTGSLSSAALRVTVVVSVSMLQNGKPDVGSIRMRDYLDGNDTDARQAFEAARRAIIRCGANGYDLPVDKYNQWREIEMTFNPERMRIR